MSDSLHLERCRDPHDPRLASAMALYAQSFPRHELRLPPDQEEAMREPAYHVDLAYLDGAFAGMILYWVLPACVYVEHFCMEPALRGRGLGAQVLRQLCAQHPLVVLEIDPPVDALSIRRKGFYERCGFVANPFAHVHPPYQTAYAGHELVIMSHPRALCESEFTAFTEALCDTVMRYSEGRRRG